MGVYVLTDNKVNWTTGSAVGPADLNRIEMNLLYLAAAADISGYFGPVETKKSTEWQDIAHMTFDIPKLIVDMGGFLDVRMEGAPYRRYRINNTYSDEGGGYISFVPLATSITITVQGRGYGVETNYNGNSQTTYYTTTHVKKDPEIRVKFYR